MQGCLAGTPDLQGLRAIFSGFCGFHRTPSTPWPKASFRNFQVALLV
jgi:hypothetical protein